MDTDIDLKLEAGVPTGVDNVVNTAGCGLLLRVQFRISASTA